MKHPKCKLCSDPRRHDIESELSDGARLRALARKYKISYDSLWRHWRRHVTAAQKDRLRFGDAPTHALKGMVAAEGISVLKDLNYARMVIIEALEAAPKEDGNARAVLTGRLHENTRIRGQITGDLAKSPMVVNNHQTNITLRENSDYEQLKAELQITLDKHPDALIDVIRLFERIENQPSPALEHHADAEEADAIECESVDA